MVLDISSLISRDEEGKVRETEIPEVSIPDEPLKTLLGLVILALGFLSTSVSLSLTHERLPTSDPLPDIVLDNVPFQAWGLFASEVLLQGSMTQYLFKITFKSG